MKRLLAIALVLGAVTAPVFAQAQEDQFCAGFEEGYRTIKGDLALLPLCPLQPLVPLGSNDYREGIKAGLKAARTNRF